MEAPDGSAEAYVGRPPGGRGPGVLFVMDAIGLRPRVADMVDEIASWGYAVLAPNAFYRSGRAVELAPTEDLRAPGARAAFFATAMPRVRTLTPARVRADVGAWVAALRGLPGVAAGPLAVTGYCMGARVAVRAACEYPTDFAACGGFHGGRLATEADDSPHRLLGSARAAFAFGHATGDASMPAADVARLGDALTAAGLRHTNEVFPGPHGYTMADTAMYSPEADARHWSTLRALLAANLTTP